jgi:type I restriction enzyme M protein
MKDGPKNRLRDQDIHKIVDVFNKQTESPRYSRMVPLAEIEKNDFNLNLPRYIDSQQAEDLQDIAGHLQGGIPEADLQALDSYWAVCPKLQQSLFKKNRKGYLDLKVDKADIKKTIYEHPEFTAFIGGMNHHFAAWREKTSKTLKALKPGFHPKQMIATLSETLLDHYRPNDGSAILHSQLSILNSYDIYQHLMDYWSEAMQDDCYAISADGWKAEPTRLVLGAVQPEQEGDRGKQCRQRDPQGAPGLEGVAVGRGHRLQVQHQFGDVHQAAEGECDRGQAGAAAVGGGGGLGHGWKRGASDPRRPHLVPLLSADSAAAVLAPS